MTGFNDLKFRVSCLLQTGHFTPNEILVSFDFDGTLGARRSQKSQFREKLDRLSIEDTHDQEKLSVDMMHDLNTRGIPYFVNTAAENPCRARESMNLHHARQMPPSTVLLQHGLNHTTTPETIDHFGTRLKRCGHVLSAMYDKHVPIDYILHNLRLPTKVIIHVDDGIINLKTVLGAGFTQDVIGMYFPTIEGTIIGTEPNTDEAYQYLNSDAENVHYISPRHCTDSCTNAHHRTSTCPYD
jgi:hypothetical protein